MVGSRSSSLVKILIAKPILNYGVPRSRFLHLLVSFKISAQMNKIVS